MGQWQRNCAGGVWLRLSPIEVCLPRSEENRYLVRYQQRQAQSRCFHARASTHTRYPVYTAGTVSRHRCYLLQTKRVASGITFYILSSPSSSSALLFSPHFGTFDASHPRFTSPFVSPHLVSLPPSHWRWPVHVGLVQLQCHEQRRTLPPFSLCLLVSSEGITLLPARQSATDSLACTPES